jgi:two-component system sensor histidine kinase UhpB
VQLEAAKVSWDDDLPHAQAKVSQALEDIRRGLGETRRAIHALRATPLEDLGLALALRALAETTAERAGLELRWYGADTPDNLSTEMEQGIYRIAEQALTNIAQHAAARTLEVHLTQEGARLTLTIADDGQGFDLDAASDAHYGLRGMRERAALLGATLEINSRPGQGTQIRLRVEEAV